MNDGLPTPIDSAADGTQEKGAVDEVKDQVPPLEGVFIGAVRGLAETDPRSLGRDAAPKFMTSIVQHLTDECEKLTRKLSIKEQQLDAARNELETSKINSARISGQLLSANGAIRVGQWTGLIGGPILGLAGDMYKNNENSAMLLGCLGLCVLILPIVVSFRRTKG